MKIHSLLLLCLLFISSAVLAQAGKTYHVKSPDGKIDITVTAGDVIQWSVNHEGTEVIMPSTVSLTLSGGEVLGKNASVKRPVATSADQTFSTPIYKKDKVHDHYNQLMLTFKGDYGLTFRAYNDGAAYRFVTQKKGEITIINEDANFNFKDDDKAFLPFVNDYRNKDKFNTSFESHYDVVSLSGIKKDTLAFLPALVNLEGGKKAVILEADLQDYPGMYLTPGNGQNLHGVFAAYPTEERISRINYVVDKRADYIAKTSGTRSFPWRVVVISTEDRQLADNDMVQRLAEPSHITDYSWIKPGKVAWDWWN
ncbi:MAG: glycoside hydrolase family 97 N-terminal domain-containing protein, partial [Bacteroidota bacterium]|nr:glycoside hydrolase family 97 N-terminal domain-containing protein [Bacteroidota bacterium]